VHDFLLIGIGASAGGLTPLSTLVKRMPPHLNAAVFVVMHLSLPNPLKTFLNSPGGLPIRDAIDLDRFEPGNCYVCPADRYLEVENGILRVEQSPKESVHRPSVNALFRSAALNYGRRMVGVLLSGALYDGSAGLWQIKKHGGVTIVQDPAEAKYPDMPQHAINHVGVDFVLPVSRIADKLIELTAQNRARACRAREGAHRRGRGVGCEKSSCRARVVWLRSRRNSGNWRDGARSRDQDEPGISADGHRIARIHQRR